MFEASVPLTISLSKLEISLFKDEREISEPVSIVSSYLQTLLKKILK